MGNRYTSKSIIAYDTVAPDDDGSQNASNLITWAKHKTKLGDPIKTLAEDINTALVNAFDYSVRQITDSDATVATDHMKVVEIAPTVSSAITVSLGTASTMTNIYRVFVRNSSTIAHTIGRTTASDTIDGVAGNIVIPSKTTFCFQTTTGADGYLTLAAWPGDVVNLTEDATPAVSDTIQTYDLSVTRPKKVQLDKFFKVINGLTEDTSPVTGTDYVATYDASASAAKKVLLGNITPTTLGTENNNTSTVSVVFSGLPSGIKEITLSWVGLSTNGTSQLLIRIGPVAGVETTSYVANTGWRAGEVDSTIGFPMLAFAVSAAATYTGSLTLALQDASTNNWSVKSGNCAPVGSGEVCWLQGNKSLAGALENIGIYTAGGTNRIDVNGGVNVSYRF